MFIGGVEFPQAVIDAHRRGELVIFVGAGASRGSPSDLPDFRTLTSAIAADGKVEVTDEELDRPDVLLGDLADHRDIDVHQRVATRIGTPSSQPNPLHEAIVALAASSPPLRIVTTNYDLHLSTALTARGWSATTYMAPALPMGNDFDGLVYLHGCLQQDPRALVVTDEDFGRAYLSDAWAARFLERMFTRYTVLFIGYSHNDVVMSYLARGLGRASAHRFVLTPDPDGLNWKRLRIQPIEYSLVDGSHDALIEATASLAAQMSMGLLEHRQQIAEMVAAPPSLVPEQASYMEAVIADSERVGSFTELARGAEWLSWAADQPEFQRLFDPAAAATDCTRPLAYWFAEHYAQDEELTNLALSVVRETGGQLGREVWSAIGHSLHMRQGDRPGWLGPWVVLLVENHPQRATEWLDYALVASRWPEDVSVALLLFDHLTEPLAGLQRSFGPDEAPEFGVTARGRADLLRDAWENLFVPNLAEAAPAILTTVDRHLHKAYQLLAAAGMSQHGRDLLSFRRSAIESHPQDNLREPFDVLIDAARDCVEALLNNGDPRGPGWLDAWAATEMSLLRRLAVHGWVHRNDLDATAKVQWLRERGWLFEPLLRHEVFALIESALGDTDTDVADALVTEALAGPENPEDRDYQIHNALTWMARHAPGLQSARHALDRMAAEHPEFVEASSPDLVAWWVVSDFVPAQPPMTSEALHLLIEADAAAATTELRRYEAAQSPFDRPNWNSAIGVLVETIRDWPSDGFAVLDAIDDHPEVVGAVIRGWARATLDEGTATSVIERLCDIDLAAVAEDVVRLLANVDRNDGTPTKWHQVEAGRVLAAKAWEALDTVLPHADVDDWLREAINDPAGQLARFWTEAVAADWRDANDSWEGLPAAVREQIEVLLAGNDARTAMAEIFFASQLHFFFAADRSWCERWVLPLLDWANPTRARRTWDGFLFWGRWNDPMLTAGLLTHYMAAAAHNDEFTNQIRERLCEHLAVIAISSELDPIENGWVHTFATTVGDQVRAAWMTQIGWRLSKLPVEAVEHQWQRWMRQYWQMRLDSVPRTLSDEEASAMASWVPYLGGHLAEGAELAIAHPARLVTHSDLLRHLTHERIAPAPTEITAFVAHLLHGTPRPFYDCHQLRELVHRLHDLPTPPDTTPIIEQAIRLDCNNTSSW